MHKNIWGVIVLMNVCMWGCSKLCVCGGNNVFTYCHLNGDISLSLFHTLCWSYQSVHRCGGESGGALSMVGMGSSSSNPFLLVFNFRCCCRRRRPKRLSGVCVTKVFGSAVVVAAAVIVSHFGSFPQLSLHLLSVTLSWHTNKSSLHLHSLTRSKKNKTE